MSTRSAAHGTAAHAWAGPPPGALIGGPRDRPASGALPTNVDCFRALVWQPLAAADASGRRWLAALAAFELLRHGAAEPGGVLRANARRIAAMLGVAETTWCRSSEHGRSGYAPLLEAAGLLVREDWGRWRLPAWEALQHRAPDATLQGRFVYTHRPTFRATVVRWRLAGVSLAALGAWSLLRYCHTRWDTAELPHCDAAIARLLGVKAHTWAGWADALAGCGALEQLPNRRWRLPCYFVLRTGRGLDEARTQPSASDVGNGQVHAGAAVRLHASSADRHAQPAAALCDSRARVDLVVDGGTKELPGGDVERTLELLAASAGDAWQQQIRTSATLRARCAALLARTGWSPHRLAAELTVRELRSAREPVGVLVYRARGLLDAAPAAPPAQAPAGHSDSPQARGHEQLEEATDAACRTDTPPVGVLDALDHEHRDRLLAAARARLRRIGLPRTGDLPDHHPLLRGEALNLLHAAVGPADTTEAATTAVAGGSRPAVAEAAGDADLTAPPSVSDPDGEQPGDTHAAEPVGETGDAAATSPGGMDAQTGNADAVPPTHPLPRGSRRGGCRRPRSPRTHRPPRQRWARTLPPSEGAAVVPDPRRPGAARVAPQPRSRDPPGAPFDAGACMCSVGGPAADTAADTPAATRLVRPMVRGIAHRVVRRMVRQVSHHAPYLTA